PRHPVMVARIRQTTKWNIGMPQPAVGLFGRPPVGFRYGAQARAHRALFKVKLAGAAFVKLSHLPMKPTSVTVPPFGMTAFQLGFPTVTRVPLWLTVPFHSCLRVWRLANHRCRAQPLRSAGPRLLMARLTWYPPVQ